MPHHLEPRLAKLPHFIHQLGHGLAWFLSIGPLCSTPGQDKEVVLECQPLRAIATEALRQLPDCLGQGPAAVYNIFDSALA